LAVDAQTVVGTFEPSLFLPSLVSTTKNEVLRELVGHVQSSGLVRETAPVLEMLKRREQLGSTGIGHGIAVPHGRSLSVQRLVAGFAKHEKGVEWGSVDDKPVHLIFLILAPPVEQPNRYLPFLGRIVEAINDPDRRSSLGGVNTFPEFQRFLHDALA
jgi:mannitol/fructose-specific phosphotransferase system IIA component (Ntr-type)